MIPLEVMVMVSNNFVIIYRFLLFKTVDIKGPVNTHFVGLNLSYENGCDYYIQYKVRHFFFMFNYRIRCSLVNSRFRKKKSTTQFSPFQLSYSIYNLQQKNMSLSVAILKKNAGS